jgi:hypothetical protein
MSGLDVQPSWIEAHVARAPLDVDRLDLEELERGLVHRLGVALIEDAASRPVRVPALVAHGAEPGPVVGLTAAIHGNELNGVPAIHKLFRRIDPARLRGTVVGVPIANVPAYTRQQRTYTDGADLNRVFPGRPDGNESQVYAHRLLDRIIRKFHVLLDLHTASFGRVNSYYVRADLTNPVTARMARALGADVLLHNRSADGTLRGAAEELGIPSITVEIGDPHVFDAEMVRASRIGLRDVLEQLGMLDPDEESASRKAIECVRSFWLYADTGGLLTVPVGLAHRVHKGDVVANLVDPWGQPLRTYRAPEDAVVVGKAANPVCRAGSRIIHLGIPGAPS